MRDGRPDGRRLRPLLAVAALALALGACGGDEGGSGAQGGGEPIKIGLLTPLTGPEAVTGEAAREWADVMERRLTEPGGALEGRTVEVVTYDSQLDPATAATQARRLVTRDQVVAISCCLSSSEALQVSAIAAQMKVPVVGGAVLGQLTEEGSPGYGWYFRAIPGEDDTLRYNVDYAVEQGWDTVAISHSNLEYGTNGLERLTEMFGQEGIEVVGAAPIAGDATEATGQASRLARSDPDGVLVWDYPAPTAVIIRDLRNVGYAGEIVTNWSAHNDVLWAVAGRDVSDVFAHTTFDAEKPYAAEMLDAFEQVHDKRLDGQQANEEGHFLEVIGLGIANALKSTDDPTGEDVQKGLLAIKDYPTDDLLFGAPGTQLTYGRPYESPTGQNPYHGASIDWLSMETPANGEWTVVEEGAAQAR